MNDKDNYWKRQVYFMSNLGIFYILIIALFAVPLVGTFVVVIIQGVIDFRYAILTGGVIGFVIACYYLCKGAIRLYRRFRRDGEQALREMQTNARTGTPAQLSLFNGFLTFSYGGDASHSQPALPPQERRDLIGYTPEPPRPDPIGQLRMLNDLKAQGVIDAAEFELIKKRVIDRVRHGEPDADGS